MARDGMLARYSCKVFLKSGYMYDDKIVFGKKRITMQTLIVCFWKHFKMKMSEIDRTNSWTRSGSAKRLAEMFRTKKTPITQHAKS